LDFVCIGLFCSSQHNQCCELNPLQLKNENIVLVPAFGKPTLIIGNFDCNSGNRNNNVLLLSFIVFTTAAFFIGGKSKILFCEDDDDDDDADNIVVVTDDLPPS
jgi:hypothetical protein